MLFYCQWYYGNQGRYLLKIACMHIQQYLTASETLSHEMGGKSFSATLMWSRFIHLYFNCNILKEKKKAFLQVTPSFKKKKSLQPVHNVSGDMISNSKKREKLLYLNVYLGPVSRHTIVLKRDYTNNLLPNYSHMFKENTPSSLAVTPWAPFYSQNIGTSWGRASKWFASKALTGQVQWWVSSLFSSSLLFFSLPFPSLLFPTPKAFQMAENYERRWQDDLPAAILGKEGKGWTKGLSKRNQTPVNVVNIVCMVRCKAGFVKQAFFHRMTGLVESHIHVNAVYLSLAKAFHFIAYVGMIKKHTLYGIKKMHFGRTKSKLPDSVSVSMCTE